MTKNGRVTLKDVAEVAGVSFKTVSRVANNDPNVRDELRQRILRIIDEMGYHPNHAARLMRSGTSSVIGLMTDRISTTPYAGNIVKGAQEAAWKHGQMLFIMNTDEDDALQKIAIDTMINRGVDGLIFAAVHHRRLTQEQVSDLKRGIPTVLVDCSSPDESISSMVPDEEQAGYEATRVLIEAGHTRIGFINGPARFPAAVGRHQGYLRALTEAGVSTGRELVVSGGWWQRDGYDNASRLLSLSQPPTAIFCASDRIAMGAYDAIKERGMKIPDDVAIVGFDNHEIIAAHLRPALTTMEIPYYHMGRWAVERVLQLKENPELPATFELAHCSLILRNSAGSGVPQLAE
ncbi:LacI family DNA-binding transcriptional regulator [Deinococcus roseus]|uniref:Alanine racemase n=1 Tax=Deinococcus roseus TaxID=392414 RepID=A0ABQ2D2Q7_9DEIO|nr:LacI family DNA-binding transcriptional regulator [Deinococcus roseus]GGJ43581.1 alanine racemase [Deinococcus roseus]